SVFDACAHQTRDLIEAMRKDAPEAFVDGGELRIDGGMARSPWFAQRLADLTGLPCAPAVEPETTALGAALFAALGAGLFDSLEGAVEACRAAEALRPALAEDERALRYARWRDAVARCRGVAPGSESPP